MRAGSESDANGLAVGRMVGANGTRLRVRVHWGMHRVVTRGVVWDVWAMMLLGGVVVVWS